MGVLDGLGVNVARSVTVIVAVCVQVSEGEGVKVSPGWNVAIGVSWGVRRSERAIVSITIPIIPAASKIIRTSWRGFCSGAED